MSFCKRNDGWYLEITSLYNASATYHVWKARISHIESVTFWRPPRRVACSQSILILIRTHKIRPGRSSLKDFRSKEPIDGLSSRPMNHYVILCFRDEGKFIKKRTS